MGIERGIANSAKQSAIDFGEAVVNNALNNALKAISENSKRETDNMMARVRGISIDEYQTLRESQEISRYTCERKNDVEFLQAELIKQGVDADQIFISSVKNNGRYVIEMPAHISVESLDKTKELYNSLNSRQQASAEISSKTVIEEYISRFGSASVSGEPTTVVEDRYSEKDLENVDPKSTFRGPNVSAIDLVAQDMDPDLRNGIDFTRDLLHEMDRYKTEHSTNSDFTDDYNTYSGYQKATVFQTEAGNGIVVIDGVKLDDDDPLAKKILQEHSERIAAAKTIDDALGSYSAASMQAVNTEGSAANLDTKDKDRSELAKMGYHADTDTINPDFIKNNDILSKRSSLTNADIMASTQINPEFRKEISELNDRIKIAEISSNIDDAKKRLIDKRDELDIRIKIALVSGDLDEAKKLTEKRDKINDKIYNDYDEVKSLTEKRDRLIESRTVKDDVTDALIAAQISGSTHRQAQIDDINKKIAKAQRVGNTKRVAELTEKRDRIIRSDSMFKKEQIAGKAQQIVNSNYKQQYAVRDSDHIRSNLSAFNNGLTRTALTINTAAAIRQIETSVETINLSDEALEALRKNGLSSEIIDKITAGKTSADGKSKLTFDERRAINDSIARFEGSITRLDGAALDSMREAEKDVSSFLKNGNSSQQASVLNSLRKYKESSSATLAEKKAIDSYLANSTKMSKSLKELEDIDKALLSEKDPTIRTNLLKRKADIQKEITAFGINTAQIQAVASKLIDKSTVKPVNLKDPKTLKQLFLGYRDTLSAADAAVAENYIKNIDKYIEDTQKLKTVTAQEAAAVKGGDTDLAAKLSKEKTDIEKRIKSYGIDPKAAEKIGAKIVKGEDLEGTKAKIADELQETFKLTKDEDKVYNVQAEGRRFAEVLERQYGIKLGKDGRVTLAQLKDVNKQFIAKCSAEGISITKHGKIDTKALDGLLENPVMMAKANITVDEIKLVKSTTTNEFGSLGHDLKAFSNTMIGQKIIGSALQEILGEDYQSVMQVKKTVNYSKKGYKILVKENTYLKEKLEIFKKSKSKGTQLTSNGKAYKPKVKKARKPNKLSDKIASKMQDVKFKYLEKRQKGIVAKVEKKYGSAMSKLNGAKEKFLSSKIGKPINKVLGKYNAAQEWAKKLLQKAVAKSAPAIAAVAGVLFKIMCLIMLFIVIYMTIGSIANLVKGHYAKKFNKLAPATYKESVAYNLYELLKEEEDYWVDDLGNYEMAYDYLYYTTDPGGEAAPAAAGFGEENKYIADYASETNGLYYDTDSGKALINPFYTKTGTSIDNEKFKDYMIEIPAFDGKNTTDFGTNDNVFTELAGSARNGYKANIETGHTSNIKDIIAMTDLMYACDLDAFFNYVSGSGESLGKSSAGALGHSPAQIDAADDCMRPGAIGKIGTGIKWLFSTDKTNFSHLQVAKTEGTQSYETIANYAMNLFARTHRAQWFLDVNYFSDFNTNLERDAGGNLVAKPLIVGKDSVGNDVEITDQAEASKFNRCINPVTSKFEVGIDYGGTGALAVYATDSTDPTHKLNMSKNEFAVNIDMRNITTEGDGCLTENMVTRLMTPDDSDNWYTFSSLSDMQSSSIYKLITGAGVASGDKCWEEDPSKEITSSRTYMLDETYPGFPGALRYGSGYKYPLYAAGAGTSDSGLFCNKNNTCSVSGSVNGQIIDLNSSSVIQQIYEKMFLDGDKYNFAGPYTRSYYPGYSGNIQSLLSTYGAAGDSTNYDLIGDPNKKIVKFSTASGASSWLSQIENTDLNAKLSKALSTIPAGSTEYKIHIIKVPDGSGGYVEKAEIYSFKTIKDAMTEAGSSDLSFSTMGSTLTADYETQFKNPDCWRVKTESGDYFGEAFCLWKTEKTTYTRVCKGHNFTYCGGHVGAHSHGIIYSTTNEQSYMALDEDKDKSQLAENIDKKIWTNMEGKVVKAGTDKSNIGEHIDATLGKAPWNNIQGSYFGMQGINLLANDGGAWDTCSNGFNNIAFTELTEAYKYCKDIFDIDTGIRYGANIFPLRGDHKLYEGWTSDNMYLTCARVNADWNDIYGFDIPLEIGERIDVNSNMADDNADYTGIHLFNTALSTEDVEAISDALKDAYGSSYTEARKDSVERALKWVGRGHAETDMGEAAWILGGTDALGNPYYSIPSLSKSIHAFLTHGGIPELKIGDPLSYRVYNRNVYGKIEDTSTVNTAYLDYGTVNGITVTNRLSETSGTEQAFVNYLRYKSNEWEGRPLNSLTFEDIFDPTNPATKPAGMSVISSPNDAEPGDYLVYYSNNKTSYYISPETLFTRMGSIPTTIDSYGVTVPDVDPNIYAYYYNAKISFGSKNKIEDITIPAYNARPKAVNHAVVYIGKINNDIQLSSGQWLHAGVPLIVDMSTVGQYNYYDYYFGSGINPFQNGSRSIGGIYLHGTSGEPSHASDVDHADWWHLTSSGVYYWVEHPEMCNNCVFKIPFTGHVVTPPATTTPTS